MSRLSVFLNARPSSKQSKNSYFSNDSQKSVPVEKVKVENITKHSFMEKLNFKLDVLVPSEEEHEILLPKDCYLQQVHRNEQSKWRAIKNRDYNLPSYLTDHKKPQRDYKVITPETGIFTALQIGGPFLKKWNALALVLLLFTASVTPFETAFIKQTAVVFDLLFLMNRVVDLVFWTDLFVQMKTPYRDETTGRMILDVKEITSHYIRGWFFLDLISVIPFEFLQYVNSSPSLGKLQLLRFFRLTRLLKLLRLVRATRKLKDIQILAGLRYYQIELLKIMTSLIFFIHWLACGYRLISDQQSLNDPRGWLHYYAIANNFTSSEAVPIDYAYYASLYWSAGVVTLTGSQNSAISPTTNREFLFSAIANVVAYLFMIYAVAVFSSITHATGEAKQKQDIQVDNYLEMIDSLRIDPRLKLTVYHHLTDLFADEASHKQSEMLNRLPKSLHAFICIEVYIDFIMMIPYLEPFVDQQQAMIREICLCIERKMIAANHFLFNSGLDGIYRIDEGIVAMNGIVYTSGSVIGLTCIRNNIKNAECRALTDVKATMLPRNKLLEILGQYPRVKYYCKRWTHWQLVRDYILEYKNLYYTAARRGMKMNPPLVCNRPNMKAEDTDEIDLAVLDHIEENGY